MMYVSTSIAFVINVAQLLVGIRNSMSSYLDILLRLATGLPISRVESIRSEAESYLQVRNSCLLPLLMLYQ